MSNDLSPAATAGDFCFIPATVWGDPDLTLPEKVLAGRIFALSRRDGWCIAGNDYFEEELGVSDRSIRSWLGHLIEAGHVEREVSNTAGGGRRRLRFVMKVSRRKPASAPPEGDFRPAGSQLPPHSKEEEESGREERRGERAADGNGIVAPGDLFDQTPDPVARAIGQFCERLGVPWKLRATIPEWSREIQSEPRYAGVDFPYQIRRCLEWHEGKGRTPKAPDRSIRNWLERAAKDLEQKQASKERGPDWLEGLEDDWGAEA